MHQNLDFNGLFVFLIRFCVIERNDSIRSTPAFEMRTKTSCTFGSCCMPCECGVRSGSFSSLLIQQRIQSTWTYCFDCKLLAIQHKHSSTVFCFVFSTKLFSKNLNRSFAVEQRAIRKEEAYCLLVRLVTMLTGTTMVGQPLMNLWMTRSRKGVQADTQAWHRQDPNRSN